jgi:uncharacterized protein
MQAITLLVTKTPSLQGPLLHLRCLVRPGVSAGREGVSGVTAEHIQISVSAPAQDGKANKAVLEVLSSVCVQRIFPNL